MKISLNWLKKFAKIDAPDAELFTRIGARLVEIESVENLAEKYRDVVVAKVVSCAPHPDSDHMHVLKIDDAKAADAIVERNILAGNATEKDRIPRDGNGLVTVVCGAPNVREGLTVAWLPPTAAVPSEENIRLRAKKLRGVVSYGMCAAPDELGLWDEHDGILELADDWAAGENFAQKLELDDQILEVENKSLTHRPDTFGIIGFAREVAAIFGEKSVDPGWLAEENRAEKMAQNYDFPAPKVDIADPKICARYEGIIVKNADGRAESSLLRKTFLARSGVRPISAIVDITNYLMLLTGQPLHAFDYDKLAKISPTGRAEIVVRLAQNGEKLTLLDDREIELSEKDIVVAAGDRENSVVVALAGAMGGKSTEIDENTRNIFLESATFNLYNLRGTQFRHGVFSEAITRFTKGQPAALTDPVLRRALAEFQKIGGEAASEIAENYADKTQNPAIEISADDVNSVLGAQYSDAEIREVLRNLSYEVDDDFRENSRGKVTAPWWRTDVKIREDVIEDVGRVRGFDDIALDLPRRKFTAVANQPLYDLEKKSREILKLFGANEILSYSFLSRKLSEKVGQNPENSYEITNAISPDLELVRQSLIPKLLEKTRENLRAGYDDFALFEIGQTFAKNDGLTEENVPIATNKLALVIAAKNREDAAFFMAKKFAENLLARLGIAAEIRAKNELESPYETRRAAAIFDAKNAEIGRVGELENAVREKLKLPKFVAIFELDLDKILLTTPENPTKYRALAKFPGTSRDMTFAVNSETDFATIENEIRKTLANLPENIRAELDAKDVFSPEKSQKNFTFHLEIWDLEKTIDANFVAKLVDKIARNLAREIGAKVI